MRKLRPRRPSPAMVVAMIALVIACAGTATAATVLIHSSSQISSGVITGRNIHANTITGRQIANGAIGANQLANGAIGTSKLSGAAIRTLQHGGTSSSTSTAVGSGYEFDRQSGPSSVSGVQDVATATGVPPGTYAIFAESNLSDSTPPSGNFLDVSPTDSAQCTIIADADEAYGSTVLGGGFFAGSGDVSMQLTHTFTGTGTIKMQCSTTQGTWDASGSSIIAIRLSGAPKTGVNS